MSKSSFSPEIFWSNSLRNIWATRRFILSLFALYALVHFGAFFSFGAYLSKNQKAIFAIFFQDISFSDFYQMWSQGLVLSASHAILTGALQVVSIFILLAKYEEFHRACEESNSLSLYLKGLYWTFVRSGLITFFIAIILGTFIYLNMGALMVLALPLLLVPTMMLQTPTSGLRALYETLSFRFFKDASVSFISIMICLISIALVLYVSEESVRVGAELYDRWIFHFILQRASDELPNILNIAAPRVFFEFLTLCVEFSSTVLFAASTSTLFASIQAESQRLPPEGLRV